MKTLIVVHSYKHALIMQAHLFWNFSLKTKYVRVQSQQLIFQSLFLSGIGQYCAQYYLQQLIF